MAENVDYEHFDRHKKSPSSAVLPARDRHGSRRAGTVQVALEISYSPSGRQKPATSRVTPRLRIPLAFRHETVLGRAVQRLALCAHRFGFAGVLLAFLDEAVFGGAVQRLAGGADRLASRCTAPPKT